VRENETSGRVALGWLRNSSFVEADYMSLYSGQQADLVMGGQGSSLLMAFVLSVK
jgi:hypothetical protein